MHGLPWLMALCMTLLMLANYRSVFASQIGARGVEGLIAGVR